MLSFATEFPVSKTRTSRDFLDAALQWVVDSPYTSFKPNLLQTPDPPADCEFRSGHEYIKVRTAHSELDELIGFEYSNIGDAIEWTTTAVFSKSDLSSWVSVRTAREAEHPTIQLPPARKPVLVRTLLSKLGGGQDGSLDIQAEPLYLTDDDVDLASRILLDSIGARLPVVYVSAPFSGKSTVDVNGLANDLSGMAHVVVEPSRGFSRRLQIKASSENVYGGVVGVYWPESSGRRTSYIPRLFDRPIDLKWTVSDEIRAALLNRRPLYRTSWTSITEASSRELYEKAKNSDSDEVRLYAEAFDRDIKLRDDKIQDAEREIGRLQNEVRAYEAKGGRAKGLLNPGGEQELFPGEVEEFVVDALSSSIPGLLAGSRRHHIVTEVVRANKKEKEAAVRKDKLQDVLRSAKSLDKNARDTLYELGLELESGGKHHKATYRGDDRYVFTLSKSASDGRAGLNLASDIAKIIY